MGKYNALGPMIQGLRLPMHDLSRGCSMEDMVQTTLLAMRMGGLVKADAPAAGSTLKEA
jgi:phosphotransacetylase